MECRYSEKELAEAYLDTMHGPSLHNISHGLASVLLGEIGMDERLSSDIMALLPIGISHLSIMFKPCKSSSTQGNTNSMLAVSPCSVLIPHGMEQTDTSTEPELLSFSVVENSNIVPNPYETSEALHRTVPSTSSPKYACSIMGGKSVCTILCPLVECTGLVEIVVVPGTDAFEASAIVSWTYEFASTLGRALAHAAKDVMEGEMDTHADQVKNFHTCDLVQTNFSLAPLNDLKTKPDILERSDTAASDMTMLDVPLPTY